MLGLYIIPSFFVECWKYTFGFFLTWLTGQLPIWSTICSFHSFSHLHRKKKTDRLGMTMENLSLKSPSLLNPVRCEGTLHCMTVTLIVLRTISQVQNVAAGWSKEKCSGTRNILHAESICSVDDVCQLSHWILLILVVLFQCIFFFIQRKKTDGSRVIDESFTESESGKLFDSNAAVGCINKLWILCMDHSFVSVWFKLCLYVNHLIGIKTLQF